MMARRRMSRNILWVLAAGFALTILMLLVSAWLGLQAMEAAEARSEALIAQHRISTQLIDEIQGEEAGLSSLFYALASARRPLDHGELLRRLDAIERDVGGTLQSARKGSNGARWSGAKLAVERFIDEVRTVLSRGGGINGGDGPSRLYQAHEALVSEISGLVSANYETAIEQEELDGANHRARLRNALVLLAVALSLAVVCAVTTVKVAGGMFTRTQWQARELSRLSGHVLETQEQILHRLSRELHDEFGQSLTAIEANLAAVPAESPEVRSRIEDCTLLIKDLMGNVREMSQLLRPSALDDFGLAPSLQWLADTFSQRTGVQVETRLEFSGRLHGETETHLFRIAQEALTNVARHSGATRVELWLRQKNSDAVQLVVADNGHGLRGKSPGAGLGLVGMRERMRVTGGTLEVRSGEKGVTVTAEAPTG